MMKDEQKTVIKIRTRIKKYKNCKKEQIDRGEVKPYEVVLKCQ